MSITISLVICVNWAKADCCFVLSRLVIHPRVDRRTIWANWG